MIERCPPGSRIEPEVPVAVIGGGACGLTAALAIRDHGQEVLVLERDVLPRGSTAMSSGFIPACGTRWQKDLGINDSVLLMKQDIQTKNHQQGNPDVIDAVAEASGSVLEHLSDRHCVPLELVQGFLYPGHSVMRMHCTPRRTGEELMGSLLKACENAGADILTQCHVRTLVVDTNDRVIGLELERPDGSRERIGCQALVLACSGFGGNAILVEQYISYMKDAVFYGHIGNQGDALQWGVDLGAATADLAACQGHGSLAWPQQTLISWALMMQGGVQVNRLGRRFSNEHLGYSEQARVVLQQPERCVWNIYDSRIHQAALSFEDYRQAHAVNAVKRAASLQELAGVINVPLENFTETMVEVDRLCAVGGTDSFGRRFGPDQQLTAPWFAVQVTGALFHTQGGLEVNTQARVLKAATRETFPNLFAGGGAARGLSGADDTGYLSGNGLLSAVVLGTIAGRNAAALVAP
ncbi:MAG: FAD-dependent oxidoreductase [Betaproteobacteria bacterium]|nr:FAD-dependent oxidoreductase [Betaproteobacteria bacterium]